MLLRSSRVLGLSAAWVVSLGCRDPFLPDPDPEPEPLPAVCDGYALSNAGQRLFVVQPRLRPEVWTSYDAYREHVLSLVRSQVEPCLAIGRVNIIVFPENAGLHATFIGSRATAARAAADSTTAFVSLVEPYQPIISYYEARFGELSLPTGLELALTDTTWRAFHTTYSEIARTTGAYVIANADVARAVVPTDEPSLLELLADPDLEDVAEVFVADAPDVYNTAYVFAPSGTPIASRSKPYLVPSEETLLALRYGDVRGVRPVVVDGVRLGIVTSKDAWMPDVLDRLELFGTQILVQPEAFSGWAIEELPGDWLPAIVQQSGWAATQKYAGMRFAVIPHMTGNLFDLVFDGQSLIVEDSVPGSEVPAYVGMPPMGGVLQVAPWLAADPGLADPELTLVERREALREAAQQVLPGGDQDNAYVEAVIAADLDVSRGPVGSGDTGPGVLGASTALSREGVSAQMPDVAASGELVIAAWVEDRSGVRQVVMSRSSDGGETFEEAQALAASALDQVAPSVALVGDDVLIAWQELGNGSRVLALRSADGGSTFDEPSAPAGSSDADAADEWLPDTAILADGTAIVTLVAERAGNERVLVARGPSDAWSVIAADGPALFEAPNTRNNQWGPAVASDGVGLLLAWVDFRAFNWDVYGARSLDGGLTFEVAHRVDDGGEAPERIHADVDVVFSLDTFFVAWTDVRLRRGASGVRFSAWDDTSPQPSIVASRGPEDSWSWRPSMLAGDAGSVRMAWQDLRSGGNDPYLATLQSNGADNDEGRLDDGPDHEQQYAPKLAASTSGLIAVWEDSRGGRRSVRRVFAGH